MGQGQNFDVVACSTQATPTIYLTHRMLMYTVQCILHVCVSHLSMKWSTERVSEQVRDTPSTNILHVQLSKRGEIHNLNSCYV